MTGSEVAAELRAAIRSLDATIADATTTVERLRRLHDSIAAGCGLPAGASPATSPGSSLLPLEDDGPGTTPDPATTNSRSGPGPHRAAAAVRAAFASP